MPPDDTLKNPTPTVAVADPDDLLVCPGCKARFRVRLQKIGSKDRDSVDCLKCGTEILPSRPRAVIMHLTRVPPAPGADN